MKKARFAPAIFMIVFSCAYAGVFAMNWPLFKYYPLHGNFNWGTPLIRGVGPAMAWYGLVASAGIIALVAAVVVPDRVARTLFRDYIWVFPVGAMVVCIFLLRHFFN